MRIHLPIQYLICDLLLIVLLTFQSGIVLGQSVPSYVPTSGLVGWWGFNGNAQDGSGNGNHGTVNGATLTTDRYGNQNKAYDFDGNDWINVVQDFSSGNNPKSFSVWFKLDESTYNWILSGGVSSNSHAFGLYTENHRIWFHGDGHTTFDFNFSNITVNNWHHVAITYGAGVIKAYLNGVYIGQHSIVLNTIPNHISFGRRNNGTAYLNGKLDDIGIWNRALTQQEITNLYNAQVCQVSVTTQPSNQTATSGQNIQFLTGSSELNSTFQWQSNSGSGFQDVVDGGQYSGSSTSTLSITGITSQNNNQELRCIVSTQNCGSDTSDVATLNVTNPNGLTGTLMYAHTPASPLVGVPVHLKSYLGYTAASDTTDSTGTYHLVGFPNGNYYLDADINYEVNSINSSDALLAQRFVVMLEMLSNLQQKSADVTGDQRIRTSDALMITRYTASLINQFPVGNFVNTRPDVTASGSVQSVNMLALASGDVNGNLLVQSSPPTLVLDTVYSSGTQGTATVRFTTSGSGIYERGVCWGTSPNPTIDSNKSVAGAGGFGFTHSFGGLTGGTQYYARAYAINSAGTYYSNERSFTTDTWSRCPGIPTVTDIDGNVYSTVQIGGLCWMQRNLNVGRYQNGNNLLSGLTETQWSLASTGAFSFYNNDTSAQTMFGRLYNWYSVNDPRGLCPVNWRIPTDGEYSSLIQLYGGSTTAGGSIKSTSGWVSNIGSTNSSGFSGIPGGYRLANGYFNYLGAYGYWWSSEASGQTDAWCLALYANTTSAFRDATDHRHGFSVRCVNDVSPISVLPTVMTNPIIVASPSVVTTGGIVTLDGQSFVYARGVAFGTSPNPLVSGNKTNDGAGTGSFSSTVVDLYPATTYYIRAYATNGVGTAYGGELSFVTPPLPPACPNVPVVSDIDGNIYNTIKIGDQCWLQSNLRVSKYRNGDHLMNLPSTTQWHQASSGAWCNYYNNFAFDSVYGKLYNRFAIMDYRGLCPLGWHIPSDVEWAVLSDFLGGDSIAGGKLKTSGTSYWSSPNIAATNSSGFAGLPGGFRKDNGDFDLSYAGYWWSSAMDLQGNPWMRQLSFSNSEFIRSSNPVYSFPKNGLSVRCLKNTLPQVNTTSVTNVTPSTALVTGEIISEGDQNTIRGFCYSITSNPTISNDTTMNGIGLGVYSGTLQNLTPSTTYYVRAYATNSVGTSYGNEINFMTVQQLNIGMNYQGGIIFHLAPNGQNGLICAPVDQSSSARWGCTSIMYNTSTLIGSGQSNTNSIINLCSTRPIAASICNDLNLNSFNDWYLPSLDELYIMIQNLHPLGLGNFSANHYYQSSSESGINSTWIVSPTQGVNMGCKGCNGRVRAIRSF